jgi:hypothetical protein
MSIDTVVNEDNQGIMSKFADFGNSVYGKALGLVGALGLMYAVNTANIEKNYQTNMPTITQSTANAQVTNLNVTPHNYKSVLESIGTCIVMYNHRDISVKDGEVFIDLLDKKFSSRIPIYRIEMGSWPDSEVYKWIENENERNIFPSYHVFINGKRDVRIRGPPIVSKMNESINKLDNYLKDKGI